MEPTQRDSFPWITWDSNSEDFQQQLRQIFNLCDEDRDGVVTAGEFRRATQQHLGTEQMEELLLEVDPDNQGVITFEKFKKGIQSVMAATQRHSNNSSRCSDSLSLSSSDEAEGGSSSQGEFDSALSVEDVHHWDRTTSPFHSTGFETLATSSPVHGDSASTVHCEELESDNTQSVADGSFNLIIRPSSISPTLRAKSLMRKQNYLQVSRASSNCSTPEMKREEDVEHLSDKLEELSSRLGGLEVDLDTSQSQTVRLKKENMSLKEMLGAYEERLEESEQVRQDEEKRKQEEQKATLLRIRRENELEMDELRLQLAQSQSHAKLMQDSLTNLRDQFDAVKKEIAEREEVVEGLEVQIVELQGDQRKLREQSKLERERWKEEKASLQQELSERQVLVEQLRREVEESKLDQRRSNISQSDMQTSEILRLRQEIQSLKQENNQLSAHLVQQGQQLVAPVPSLAQELENAPKDELMKALKETEEVNSRLQTYIDSLLITIINKHPELLEKQ